MSRSPVRIVQKNDPVRIQAGEFNSWQETAQAFMEGRTRPSGQGGIPRLPIAPLLVQNKTGSNQSAFAIVQIEDATPEPDQNLSEFKQRASFVGISPAEEDKPVAILQAPALVDKYVEARLFGISTALVNITDEGHTLAKPIVGDTSMLESDASTGLFEIIYKPPGTGQKWCQVRFGTAGGGEPIVVGIVTTEITARSDTTAGTGQFQVHENQSGTYAPIGSPEDIYNAFSAQIPVDVWIGAEKDKDGNYELIAADCDPTLNPMQQPIGTANDGDTMDPGDGTVLIV